MSASKASEVIGLDAPAIAGWIQAERLALFCLLSLACHSERLTHVAQLLL